MGKLGNISGKEAARAFEKSGWQTTGESLFLRKLLWASLPNKRQKLRDRSCLRRPQPSCFFRWIPNKGYPTSFSQ